MSWITLHLASGAGLFSGTALLTLGLTAARATDARVRGLGWLVVIFGIILVALSATPLPWWSYAVWALLLLSAMPVGTMQAKRVPANALTLAAVAFGLGVVAAEARHHRRSPVPRADARALYVVGDSLSAETGRAGRAAAWPEQLATRQGIAVHNFARGGATVTSALDELQRRGVGFGDGVVLLEIGGNDQFGRTPAREFEAGLDALIRHVSAPGRVVVMFELPLLPFNNAYGRVQRRLAAEHGVTLIPKRVLVELVSPAEATTDGVHLTAVGHQRMAEMVWDVVGPALPPP